MSHLKSQTDWKLYLFSLGVLFFSGCISQSYWSWQHPEGLDAQIRQQDMAACDALAIRETNRHDYYSYYPFYYPHYDNRYSHRHRRHHYYSHYYQFNAHREFQDRRRYFRICMESKGWRKVKRDNQPQTANE